MAKHMIGNRRVAIWAWLNANGIDPKDLPQDADITIQEGPDGRVLRCETYDRTPDGHLQPDERNIGIALKVVTVPLKVEPPEWWEPYEKPTRADLLAGEEPYTDDRTVPTPGQWIWLWNRSTSAERLARAQLIVEERVAASQCQAMNHTEHIRYLEQRLGGAPPDGSEVTPPSAEGLPPGVLDSASAGASMLDAWARTPYGRNFLAHALVQLARDGWLRQHPVLGAAFDPAEQDRNTPPPKEAP